MLKIEITPQQPTTPPNLRPPHITLPKENHVNLPEAHRLLRVDARNHYPRIKHHTPPPKPGATTRLPPHTVARETRACCLKAQQCAWWPAPRNRGNQKISFVYAPELAPLRIRPVTGNESIQRIAWTTADPTRCGAGQVSWCSLERR